MQYNRLFPIFRLLAYSLINWVQILSSSFSSSRENAMATGSLLLGSLLCETTISYVFGVQNAHNGSIKHSLQVIGMSHLLSASGFAVALFMSVCRQLFSTISIISFPKKTILEALCLFFFWCVSSQTPSLSRAITMSFFSLFAGNICARQHEFFHNLFFSLLFIFFCDIQLISSLSLQFSVAAILGIRFIFPVIADSFRLDSLKRASIPGSNGVFLGFFKRLFLVLKKIILLCLKNLFFFLSVQLGMLPLISHTWGELGTLSVISNTLLAGFAPVLFFAGLLWSIWLVIVDIWLKFFPLNAFILTICHILTFPTTIFIEISNNISQVDQIMLRIPQFSLASSIFWYLGIIVFGSFYKKNLQKIRRATLSISPLIKSLSTVN